MSQGQPAADHLPALVYTLHQAPDGTQRLTYASAALRELYGLDPATAGAADLEGCIHPDDLARVQTARAIAAAARTPLCVEYRIRHPRQGERWIEERARLCEEAGERVWHGLQLDIDERRRAEAHLRLQAAALEAAREPVFLIDHSVEGEAQVIHVNAEACRVLGHPYEQLIRFSPPDFDPDITLEQSERIGAIARAEGRVTFESRHRRADGTSFPVEVRASLFEHEGRLLAVNVTTNLAERHAAQRALANSEHAYRTLVEHAPANIIRYDREGRVRYINPRLERTLGAAAATLIGLLPAEAWPDGRFAPLEAVLFRVLTHGVDETIELTYPDPQGLPVIHRIQVVAERDPDGAVCGAVAFGVDITPLRQAERAAEAARRFLDQVLDTVADPIFVKDRDHRWVLINQAFCDLLGHPREALLGRSDFDFLPAEQARAFWTRDDALFETGVEQVNEEPLTDAAGQVHTLLTRKTLFHDAQGAPLLVGIIRDISERKGMEDELRRSREGLAEAQRIACLGSWELELATGALHWSDEVFRIFELDPARFAASYEAFLAVVHPEDRGLVDAAYRRSLEERTPYAVEHRLLMPDGRIKHVQERGETRYAEDGQPLLSRGTVQEITELRAVQHQLDASRAQLRALAARHELDQEAHRKRLAWEVHEGVGQQLAGVRMQLLMLRAGADAELRERVGGMLAQVDQGIAQVRQVTAALRPRVLDLGLGAALEWLCQSFTRRTGLACDADVPLGALGLDEARALVLFRVAEEGLDNVALHAQAEWVGLRLERVRDECRLELRDDGRGFEPVAVRGGPTVGLAWMEERIQALGGGFRVESAPGRGTLIEARLGMNGDEGGKPRDGG